jgi:tripartite-type tricarboxylate transporter receptor subunit TctC
MRLFVALVGLLLMLAGSGPAFAEYPDKPIRIMAPYAPGGNIDVTARIIAGKLMAVPGVIAVTPDSPIKTMADFIRIGRVSPGKLSVADSGVGTTNHIILELVSDATGAKYTLVHYKGSGAASIDVIAGQVPLLKKLGIKPE